LFVIAFGYALVAGLTASAARGARRYVPAALGLVAVGAGAVMPPWDLTRLAGGAHVYFEKQLQESAKVVWVEEDVHGGVTTVTETDRLLTLYTNGKFQGDNGFQMSAQYGFANIPAMFAKRMGRALVIGMGTG